MVLRDQVKSKVSMPASLIVDGGSLRRFVVDTNETSSLSSLPSPLAAIIRSWERSRSRFTPSRLATLAAASRSCHGISQLKHISLIVLRVDASESPSSPLDSVDRHLSPSTGPGWEFVGGCRVPSKHLIVDGISRNELPRCSYLLPVVLLTF